MNRFEYIRPETLEAAIAAAAEPGTAVLAGGTNLLDLMKIGVALPDRVVDISRLPGLAAIERLPAGGFRIGALVKNADMARDAVFARAFPSVAEALLSGASGQIRNAASLGGNLLQATRCAYFQDPNAACNRRDPGAGCAAREGVSDAVAVLGWSPACIATHPSDMCVPLAALGAVVEIAGPGGRRDVPLDEFHPLPGPEAAPATPLAPGEIVIAIRLPPGAEAFAAHARYVKLRERTSFAFALVSAAAHLRIADGRIAEARLALGGVAARPWRAKAAEALLSGALPQRAVFAETAAAALAEARAPNHLASAKIELARRCLTRALTLAAAGSGDALPALPGSVLAPMTTEPAAHA